MLINWFYVLPSFMLGFDDVICYGFLIVRYVTNEQILCIKNATNGIVWWQVFTDRQLTYMAPVTYKIY